MVLVLRTQCTSVYIVSVELAVVLVLRTQCTSVHIVSVEPAVVLVLRAQCNSIDIVSVEPAVVLFLRTQCTSVYIVSVEPAVVLVLRGVNAFTRMEEVVRSRGPHQHTIPTSRLDKIMSPTPELAFRSEALLMLPQLLSHAHFDYVWTVLEKNMNYRLGPVNSNTVNSKIHLIQTFFKIFETFLSFQC